MNEEVLDQLRAICLALPEASEGGGVGNPSFRVRDKIFAMQHGVDGEELMKRFVPQKTIDITKETIEWARERMPLMRRS